MDAVSAVQQSGENNEAVKTTKSPRAAADYDTFLTLLVTQLRHQDPTSPTDNSELLAQLASFSAVEQQTQTNDKLDQLMAVMSLDQASSLIGMHLASTDGEVSGIIKSVTLESGGTFVTLESGKKVPVGEGVTITKPESSS